MSIIILLRIVWRETTASTVDLWLYYTYLADRLPNLSTITTCAYNRIQHDCLFRVVACQP